MDWECNLVFISTVKTAGFVCGSTSCLVLRGHFYDTVALSVHLQTEDKCGNWKVQFLWGIRVSIWSLSSVPMKILFAF